MDRLPQIVRQIIKKVKTIQENNDPAHGIGHVLDVIRNCRMIFREIECEQEVVLLAACLHDIVSRSDVDNPGDSSDRSANRAVNILRRFGVTASTIEKVSTCIRTSSWEHHVRGGSPSNTESYVLRDADLLESIGARGISRVFAFAGAHRLSLKWTHIDVAKPRRLDASADSLESPFRHFETKLLWVQELMFSNIPKVEASRRHGFLLQFIKQYKSELKWQVR
jgi:uncharacterized protein